jgi:hypothetical protein
LKREERALGGEPYTQGLIDRAVKEALELAKEPGFPNRAG